MGLGETQVFQDEKSRLANTTVARIVAAKGSLTDPDVKKECCRKLQKLNATLKDRVAAVDAAMARDAMKGGITGLGCDNRKLIAVLCTRTKASLRRRAGRSTHTWLPATAVERVTLGRLKKRHYTGGLIGEATKKLHHLRLRLDVLGVQ